MGMVSLNHREFTPCMWKMEGLFVMDFPFGVRACVTTRHLITGREQHEIAVGCDDHRLYLFDASGRR